jgi:hypothetical protein
MVIDIVLGIKKWYVAGGKQDSCSENVPECAKVLNRVQTSYFFNQKKC